MRSVFKTILFFTTMCKQKLHSKFGAHFFNSKQLKNFLIFFKRKIWRKKNYVFSQLLEKVA